MQKEHLVNINHISIICQMHVLPNAAGIFLETAFLCIEGTPKAERVPQETQRNHPRPFGLRDRKKHAFSHMTFYITGHRTT